VSALIWAAIFLEIGRHVGPRIREMFLIFPAHLIPWLLLGLALLVIGYLGYEHGFKPKAWNRNVEEPR
jgi:membrane protein DedA with SNARE-associated domain